MKRYLPLLCATACVRLAVAQYAPGQTAPYLPGQAAPYTPGQVTYTPVQRAPQQASYTPVQYAPSGPIVPVKPNGANEPPQREVFAQSGKCQVVRPGDIVHYQLTVQNVEYARAIYADLELRRGRGSSAAAATLPFPDYRNLGGGGVASRDPAVGGVYHFSFRVQPDVLSGTYHGSGVWVTLNDDGDVPGRTRSVDVTEHTRKEIKDYCLTVVSPLWGDGRPLVTDFKPGPVEHAK